MSFAASTLEWVTGIATVSAVVVALLTAAVSAWVTWHGPRAQERAGRPVIDVTAEEDVSAVEDWFAAVLRLRIHNERDKRAAEDVEVFVSTSSPSTTAGGVDYEIIQFRDVTLNFDDPEGEPPGRATASVPSGYWRPVSFLIAGPPEEISKRYGVALNTATRALSGPVDWVAIPATYPARREVLSWLDVGAALDVEVFVTGSNFDAVEFHGRFELREARSPTSERQRLVCAWSAPLTRRA